MRFETRPTSMGAARGGHCAPALSARVIEDGGPRPERRGRSASAFQALPLFNVLARRLGLEQGLADAAVGLEVLQPEEEQEVPAPLFFEAQLGSVTGTASHDSLGAKMTELRSRHVRHAAVLRYTLRDCLVRPSGVEWAGGSFRTRRLGMRDLVGGRLQETEDALFPLSPASCRYFGHFLRDACATSLLRQPGQTLLVDVPEDWPHAADYVRTFGLDAAPAGSRLVRRLKLCIDHGQGSLKTKRYREMRRRVDAVHGPRGPRTEDVYLRRGAGEGTRRSVRDEDALIDVLVRQGFRIVDVAEAGVGELARHLRRCRRIVTIEGSHLNHAHFLAPAGVDVCVLMPSDRFTLIHRGITNANGGQFGFLVCERAGDGYRVDTGRLMRLLDLF